MITPPLPPQPLNEAYTILAVAADAKAAKQRLDAIADAQAKVEAKWKETQEAKAVAEKKVLQAEVALAKLKKLSEELDQKAAAAKSASDMLETAQADLAGRTNAFKKESEARAAFLDDRDNHLKNREKSVAAREAEADRLEKELADGHADLHAKMQKLKDFIG